MKTKSFLILILFVSCGFAYSQNVSPTDQANFKFTEETWDFGDIAEGTLVTHEFWFTNIGKESLVISFISGSVTAKWPKEPVLPDNKGLITVTYQPHSLGLFMKTITIQSNAKQQSKVLFLKGKVIARPDLNSPTIVVNNSTQPNTINNNNASSGDKSLTPNVSNSNLEAVKIGNQIWSAKNLDVSTFRNGDVIPEVKNKDEWIDAGYTGKPAWCYYNNNPANGNKYGKLYNWWAVNDSRGLTPNGWHVPSNEEWKILINYLGFGIVTKMKSTSGWNDSYGRNGNGSNTSGFTGLPGGYRTELGNFVYIGDGAKWCTSTPRNIQMYRSNEWKQIPMTIWLFTCFGGGCYTEWAEDEYRSQGVSIRCIKD